LEQGRQAYLDRVRGLAVLVMVEAHVLDGWTRVAERQRPGFIYAMILGGFGAPLFLFLAGVSLVLSAESKFRRTGDLSGSWRAVQNRGWQIFGLAFLFRLQSFDGWIEADASGTGLGIFLATGTLDMRHLDGATTGTTSSDFLLFHSGASAILVNPSSRVANVTLTPLATGAPASGHGWKRWKAASSRRRR